MVIAMVLMMTMTTGCARKHLAVNVASIKALEPLDEARAAFEQGEYYRARVQVQKVLDKDPENTAAQQLMADVLDKEIARQKEAVVVTHGDVNFDQTSEEKNQSEVKTWLERSRSLFHDRQYDLALFAAEKVFAYDANNREASSLIDDIKEAAIKAGKSDSLFLSKMYQEEISERLTKYRSEARDLYNENKDEQAKFTLQKILMLEPEDKEALRLFSDLQKREAKA